MVSSDDPLKSVVGAAIVKKFTLVGDYKDEARGIAIGVLSRPIPPESFDLFLPVLTESNDWTNYRGVVRISQNLRDAYTTAWNKLQEDRDVSKSLPRNRTINAELFKQQRLVDRIYRQEGPISGLLADLIKTRPPSVNLDLTDAYLWDVNVSGTDFRGITLRNATLGAANVDGADFSLVGDCETSNWESTAWWEVRAMSSKLAAYLTKKYPYSANVQTPYPGKKQDSNEYCTSVHRLAPDLDACKSGNLAISQNGNQNQQRRVQSKAKQKKPVR